MGRYRKIDVRIWNDKKFCSLSDQGKLVFFLLLSHPNMTALGAMRATLAGLAEELGMAPEGFREAFNEVLQKGMAEHDQKACLIALPNFIRYNPPESPNVVKAWQGALDMLPECELRNRAIARARAFAEGLSIGFVNALPEGFLKGMPYQEQEQEQLTNPEGLVVASKTLAPCPHQKIIDLYVHHLPGLPCPRIWGGARQKNLAARWKWVLTAKKQSGEPYATDAESALAFFDRFFGYVSLSDFLTGRDGKWRACDLGWLVKGENFAKVVSGNYENREAA